MVDVSSLIANPGRLYIGGCWETPSSDSRFDLVNPSTEEPFLRVAEAQAEDMARAIAAARKAFDSGPWPWLSHEERGSYLTALAQALEDRTSEIASLTASENGSILSVARGTSDYANFLYRFYADLAGKFAFEEVHTPGVGGAHGLLVREPVGVVGAIIPWNAPPLLIAAKLAPALLAGCTVILKASPEAPGAAYIVGEVCDAIGIPPGVVNIVTADREVSELLVRNPDVDKITFTGSSAAGRRIASLCGDRIARCTLELGGKSAAVVYDDYDAAKVAEVLARAIPVQTGQVCAALTRVVVARSKHDELVEALGAAFAAVRVGDPMAGDTQMGPLAMRRQRDRVEDYISKGRAEGATLAFGGSRPSHLDRGFFIEPTVFANVDNGMTIAREEIFGPVVSVIPADSEQQAIEIANDTPFGLNAAIFTNDVDRAYHAARRLRSGTVGHNEMRGDFSIGFGGFKQSGIGREGGVEGLRPFLEAKTVILEGVPSHGKG